MIKCNHPTPAGFTCSNYAKHNYNGKYYCNVHLNTVKAEEECCICLCPKDNPGQRIKLGCGHFHHTACLGKMMDPNCPICRTNLTPGECSKVFTPTKVKPMFDRVFSMSGDKQKAAFGIINDLIGYIDNIDVQDELDVFKSYMSNYFTGMRMLNQAHENGLRDKPADMMYDWVDVMHGAFNHINRFNTYTGFTLVSEGTLVSWASHTPYLANQFPQDPRRVLVPTAPQVPYMPVPQAPMAPQVPMGPPIAPQAVMVPFAHVVVPNDGMYVDMPRSPSPSIPWWSH
jgi:hypothetical protein